MLNMKRKTKRRIGKFWGILFTIYGGVFGVGSLIAASLIQPLVSHIATSLQLQVPVPVWIWLTTFWFIVLMTLYSVSKVLFYIYLKSVVTPVINYFEPVNFGDPTKNTILKAIDGILNTEKVEPFYVHAAPSSKEVATVYFRVKEIGFAIVSGTPGEGKSMVAYHAACKFQDNDRYRVYALKVELLENKMGKEIIDEVLFQLDNLKGRRKLILVDDAHKLVIKQDLNTILQQEAKEGHGKYIWTETELYEEKQTEIQPDTCIRVDFQEFFGNLLKNFYQSQDFVFQEALKGRIGGLDDAINRVNKGKIHDVWWFAFCTSRREERLVQELDDLSDLKLLVLFFISAYTVLSGEAELHRNYVRSKITDLKFGWLIDDLKKSSVGDIITCLQNRKLIKIYDKSKIDKGYIASLHYNFARTTIQVSLSKQYLTKELLTSVRTLLMSEYRRCVYLGVFLRDIGTYATGFVRENKDWLTSFVNNLLVEWLKCYPSLLRGIKSTGEDTYDEIIENLDIHGIAKKVSSAEVGQFQQIAYLLNRIGDRRDEMIEELDLAQLSRTAGSAEVGQFDQLAQLLNTIGDRRDEMIEDKNFDLAKLVQKACTAEIEQFGQIEALSLALGDKRDMLTKELIKEPNSSKIAKKVSSAEVGQFDQLAHLLNAMGDRRDEMIEDKNFDLAKLVQKACTAEIEQFGQIANLLVALGGNRDKLIEKMDLKMLVKTSSDAKVEQFKNLAQLLRELGECRDGLIKELDFKNLAEAANVAEITEFEQIAHLLDVLGPRKSQLSTLLDYNTLVQKANQVGPYDIRGLTMFIAKLEEEDRSKYIREVDWSSVCLKCPINVHLLSPLGASLGNLWKQAESSSDRSSIGKVARHLRANANEIKQEVRKAHPKLYSGVAKFLWNCNQVDPVSAKQIATETMGKLAETFRIRPTEYQGTGRLINALYAIDPKLSASFVKDKKVRGRIQQSINEHDWSKEVEGLKHLIRALYCSVPELWKKMVSYKWLTGDLSSLDLDSIYRDVDEERNAGTAYNI